METFSSCSLRLMLNIKLWSHKGGWLSTAIVFFLWRLFLLYAIVPVTSVLNMLTNGLSAISQCRSLLKIYSTTVSAFKCWTSDGPVCANGGSGIPPVWDIGMLMWLRLDFLRPWKRWDLWRFCTNLVATCVLVSWAFALVVMSIGRVVSLHGFPTISIRASCLMFRQTLRLQAIAECRWQADWTSYDTNSSHVFLPWDLTPSTTTLVQVFQWLSTYHASEVLGWNSP